MRTKGPEAARRTMTAFGILSLSFVLHGVAFAAAFGHGSGTSARAGDAVQSLEIEAPPVEETVEIKAPPIKPDDEKEPVKQEQAAAMPTHTHDYPVAPSHDMTPHDPNLVHVPLAHDDDPDHKSHDKTSDPEPAPAAAPAVAAAPAAVPRFTMNASGAIGGAGGGIVASNGTGTGLGDGARGGTGDGSFGALEPASESQVDEPARVSFAPAPRYPAAAQEDGIEAEVPVEIVVDTTGAVRSARALGRVGHGLDEAAVSGVRAYRFSPAKRQGRATAVRMKWVVEFRLR
jgi:protein TonB